MLAFHWIFQFQAVWCYWPPRAGGSSKVKRGEMPDTEKWNLYEIRVFSYAGSTDLIVIFKIRTVIY